MGFDHPTTVVPQVALLIPILRSGWFAGRRNCAIIRVCGNEGVRVPCASRTSERVLVLSRLTFRVAKNLPESIARSLLSAS